MESLCAQTVVPSQSNQILTMPIQQLVSQIKVPFAFPSRFALPDPTAFQMPQGWTDGADRYPGLASFISYSRIECSYAVTQYTACSNLPHWSIRFKSFSQVRSSRFHMLTLVQGLRTPSQFTSLVRDLRDTWVRFPIRRRARTLMRPSLDRRQ